MPYRLKRAAECMSRICGGFSGALSLMMMLLVVADVILRNVGSALKGTVELVSLMLVVTGFFAMPYTWYKKNHVGIDTFCNRFPQWGQLAVKALGTLLGLLFFGAILWGGVKLSFTAYKVGEISPDLMLPLYPVKLLLVIGCAIFCFHLLVSFIDFLIQMFKQFKTT